MKNRSKPRSFFKPTGNGSALTHARQPNILYPCQPVVQVPR